MAVLNFLCQQVISCPVREKINICYYYKISISALLRPPFSVQTFHFATPPRASSLSSVGHAAAFHLSCYIVPVLRSCSVGNVVAVVVVTGRRKKFNLTHHHNLSRSAIIHCHRASIIIFFRTCSSALSRSHRLLLVSYCLCSRCRW